MKLIQTSPDLSAVYTDLQDPSREFHLPEKLDLMVTGSCPMRCEGCWGPKHNSLDPEMTPEQWMEIIWYVDGNNRADRYNVSMMASDNATVCITGGEPLLYSGIVGLTDLLAGERVHTTLSTTGIDPNGLLPLILGNIQELGIPIDGSTPNTNSLWRKGKEEGGGFDSAIQALLLAQEDFPGVGVTVRTMVHPGNISDVSLIPRCLDKAGIDPGRIDWKFYVHNDNTGPRTGHPGLVVNQVDIDGLARSIEKLEPTFRRVGILSTNSQQDRLVINHNGEVHIVLPNGEGRTVDVGLGNIVTDPNSVIKRINNDYADFLARACGRASILRYFDQVKVSSESGSVNPIIDGVKGYFTSIEDIKA